MSAKLLNFPTASIILPPSYVSIGETGITQSLLGAFQTCKRRFLYSVNGLGAPGKERCYAYGTMNHSILDILYRGFFNKDFKEKDFNNVIRIFLDKYNLPKVYRDEEVEQLKALSQASLEGYVVYYNRDFKEFRMKAVERTFDVMWKGFRLRGKVDGNLADKTGAIWNLEHKNYSKINEEALQKRLSFDLQNLFYLHADSIEYDRKLKGTLYNILRKPDVRKFSRPIEMYLYVSGLIKKDPKHYYIRYEIPYTKKDLTQFQEELHAKLEDAQDCMDRVRECKQKVLSVFYKNECACDQPYACDYLDLCSSGNTAGYKRHKLFGELGDTNEGLGVADIKKCLVTGGEKLTPVGTQIKKPGAFKITKRK